MIQNLARGVILAFVVLLFAPVAEARGYAALIMDARTGKIIHSNNIDASLHPASLTKMMTLYIVFDQVKRGRLSLDQKIKISKNAASEPPSKLGLRAGQTIELRYLIRAAAVKSANDAATALGEAVAGSEAAFAQVMNEYAKAMGMKKSRFKNAHGLTATGHMSSARDMATLGRRLYFDFPQYYNIFGRVSTSAGIKTVRSSNRRLLNSYSGADGIKTGYTRAAGFNLVSSAQRGNRRVIVVVMGAQTGAGRNAEVARLMDVGFSKMPSRARARKPKPIRMRYTAVAPAKKPAATASKTVARGSTANVFASAAPNVGSRQTLSRSSRPMSRALGRRSPARRDSETLATIIAEVNSDLAVAQTTRRAPVLSWLTGRPAPRPSKARPTARQAAPAARSASTFAVAATAPAPRRRSTAAEPATVPVASAGNTGGSQWGVELGAFRSKGDAERHLLTTALHDVPELNGGLRRVQPAKVQGLTVYRAQFVGLSQQNAQGACSSITRLNSSCETLAPGI
jgi:D-alanyl-D-alanine carboxypeptidase